MGQILGEKYAYQSWIWAAGNHGLDYIPEVVSVFFLNYIFKRMFKDGASAGEWKFKITIYQ